MTSRPLAIVLTAALGLSLAACSSSPSSTNAAAKALITKSQTAVQAQSTVHFVDVTRLQAKSETLTGQISGTEAQETLTISGSVALEVRLIGSTIYVQSTSATALQGSLSLSATQAAAAIGTWIEVVSSDSAYSPIAQSLTIVSALGIYYPSKATASLGPESKKNGVSVIPVMSTSTPATKTTEQTTLYVATSTNLPVAASLQAKQGSTTEYKNATFSDWGTPVAVTAPTGAVLLSTLLG